MGYLESDSHNWPLKYRSQDILLLSKRTMFLKEVSPWSNGCKTRSVILLFRKEKGFNCWSAKEAGGCDSNLPPKLGVRKKEIRQEQVHRVTTYVLV